MSKFCVLGGGRQGTAIAYDLLKFGNPSQVIIADVDLKQAEASTAKNKSLLDTDKLLAVQVDVNDQKQMLELLQDMDVLISAVPYHLNTKVTDFAIQSSTSMVDLGGHTGIVQAQLNRSHEAIEKGITIVPDCGMGPGMNVTMALLAMEQLDTPEHVRIWDGGLPLNPVDPWNYASFFNINGLTNEYDGDAFFIRDGNVIEVPCFEDVEVLSFGDEIGDLEAAVTSGGLSTMPWTFEGKLKTLENKTLRYFGHWNQMIAFRQLGLFDLTPMEFNETKIIPREFYHHLLEPKLNENPKEDVCIMRTEAIGENGGKPTKAVVETLEYFDEQTGFYAMEKWTGWHASMMAIRIAKGELKSGAISVENAMSGTYFLKEGKKRGYKIDIKIENLG
ncbi:MAG: NAD(P)-binding domain-containing protein [Candidatus Marinimicrobia bacterium]|nr:NAD(P)-binding domain-containing protein [Candidatus Neomarinimicrobiota bacterium]MBT7378112.1 NAD(P)-binding domain-containing protein [Candidatus Neomarinimicrobiota bacterium]